MREEPLSKQRADEDLVAPAGGRGMSTDHGSRGELIRLFDSMGIEDLSYRELGREGRDRQATERWPLLTEAVGILFSQGAPPMGAPTREGADPLCVAFVAPCGGAGRSTVVAEVATLLWQAGRRAVVVDFDLAGGLEIPLRRWGREPQEDEGPGYVSISSWAGDPSFLAGAELALIDAPPLGSPWFGEALEVAHLAVVVMPPASHAFARLPALERAIRGRREGLPIHFLLNRFDGRDGLGRDVAAALRHARGRSVLPFVVHEDLALRDAAARGCSLQVESPHSQALRELLQLGQWLEDRKGQAAAEAAR